MKILVVEDDLKAANYLVKGLTENGYSVDICHDGAEGLSLAMSRAYDLFIFDIMLPFKSGYELLRTLRANGSTTLAIFLTAKDRVEDRVTGLEFGADAYLIKPFSFSELIAVIRSLWRRYQGAGISIGSPDMLEVYDLKIDLTKHIAQRHQKVLDLTPLEFRLLTFLARREGEVLSRTLILEQIWDINFDCNTNVVDVHIRRLRTKVDEPFATPLIQTVRGVGYVLRLEAPSAAGT